MNRWLSQCSVPNLVSKKLAVRSCSTLGRWSSSKFILKKLNDWVNKLMIKWQKNICQLFPLLLEQLCECRNDKPFPHILVSTNEINIRAYTRSSPTKKWANIHASMTGPWSALLPKPAITRSISTEDFITGFDTSQDNRGKSINKTIKRDWKIPIASISS